MAATVLNSPRAVQMSIFVVRAFLSLREWASAQAELAARARLFDPAAKPWSLGGTAGRASARSHARDVLPKGPFPGPR